MLNALLIIEMRKHKNIIPYLIITAWKNFGRIKNKLLRVLLS